MHMDLGDTLPCVEVLHRAHKLHNGGHWNSKVLVSRTKLQLEAVRLIFQP